MKKLIVLLILLLSFSSFAFADDLELFGENIMGAVYVEGEFLDGDILKISVMAEEMLAPVLGIAFHLKYDFEALAFLKYEPGEFLERGGDPFYMVQNNEDIGKLIFGETLRREDDFPLGDGRIADFYFQTLEEKEFEFVFERGVISTLDVVRQDLHEILWDDVTLKRGDGSEVIYSSKNGKASVFDIRKDNDYSSFVPIFLVGLAGVLGFLFIFLLKKQEKKRVSKSVNFK